MSIKTSLALLLLNMIAYSIRCQVVGLTAEYTPTVQLKILDNEYSPTGFVFGIDFVTEGILFRVEHSIGNTENEENTSYSEFGGSFGIISKTYRRLQFPLSLMLGKSKVKTEGNTYKGIYTGLRTGIRYYLTNNIALLGTVALKGIILSENKSLGISTSNSTGHGMLNLNIGVCLSI